MAPVTDATNSTHWFDERHVLYSKLRPYLNKVVVPGKRGIATTELVPMMPDPTRLNRKYLAHYLKSRKFVSWVSSQVAGAKMPRVSMKVLWDHQIPLPPLSEQKRIAAILDKADAIRKKRQAAIKLAEEFLRAVFLDMFGDPVTNPKGWDVRPLLELCDVRDGTYDSPKYVYSGYPLITSKNLKDGFVDFSDVNLISEEDYLQINKRSAVEKGDIIMPMIGTIGNPVLIETSKKFAIKNVALIKFKDAKTNNKYVLHLLKSHYFKWIIQKSNRGGTQKFIALKDIRSFPIPVPDQGRQKKFGDFCQKCKTLHIKKSDMDSTETDLFLSLTQSAFRGEL